MDLIFTITLLKKAGNKPSFFIIGATIPALILLSQGFCDQNSKDRFVLD